jgi:protein gp37
MGTKTGIEWTDHTFNPWIGCTKVSAGCANCYAKTRDDRHMLGPVSHWGPGAPRHITSAANWREPIRWAKAARAAGRRDKVFCASQADIFELEAPVAARQALWRIIGDTCDALDWQLLTKRPHNILPVMCDDNLNLGFFELTRCWLGVSVENQEAADKRIPELLAIDAAVRFISAEPLLGALEIHLPRQSDYPLKMRPVNPGIDWVICGGESGPGARPMHSDWARSLRDQCASAGVPFFFKQWGEFVPFGHEQGGPVSVSHDGEGHYSAAWQRDFESRPTKVVKCGHADNANAGIAVRIGKKAAGCMLDGREWKQFPAVCA